MNAIIVLAALLDASPPLAQVVVPERDEPAACFANETLASALRLSPGLRVVRVRPLPNETLAQLEHRTQAQLVIDGLHPLVEGRPRSTLEIHAPGRPAARRTAHLPILDLLSEMWPEGLVPPPRVPAFAAANPAALIAACADDEAAALEHSGLALGDAVRRRLARSAAGPGARAPASNGRRVGRPLLERWLEASKLVERGEHGRAFPLLLEVDKELGVGVSAPLWRRGPAGAVAPSAVEVHGDFAFVFGGERLRVLELASGETRLELSAPRLEPRVAPIAPERVLAFGRDRVFELELGPDPRVRREVSLEGPHPEVARAPDALVIAGRFEVLALSPKTLEVLWRQELTDDLPAGPLLLGDRLVVPGDARLFVLARESGKLVETLDLPDELAGPGHAEPEALYLPLGGDQVARLTWNGSPSLVVWSRELFGASWPPVAFEDTVALSAQAPRRPPFIAALAGAERPFVRVLERGAGAPLQPLPGGGLVFADARRTTLTGKDAKGRVVLRARAPQPFEVLTTGARHVFARAGAQVLVLDALRGEIEQRIELGAPPLASAHGDQGGVALVRDGAVYGLPPVVDLRMVAFRREVRRMLADAAARSGRLAQAKRWGEELLQATPDDLDGLAIIARATPRGGAASGWLRVLERSPPADPLYATARAELAELTGLYARILPEAPIRRVHTPSAGPLLVELERRVLALAARSPEAPAWSLPKGEAALAGRALYLDDALYDAETGARLRRLEGRRPLEAPGLFFLSGGAEPQLSAEEPSGAVLYSQRFEERSPRVLDAGPAYVVVAGDGDEGAVHVLAATDGTRRWMRPFEERIEAAHLLGEALFLRTGTRLIAVEADTGKLRFELALPKNEPVLESFPGAAGLLLLSAQRLTLHEPKRGRVVRVLPLSAAPRRWAWADPVLWLSAEDGSLTGFDTARGRRGGRLALDPPEQLFVSEGQLGVVEAGGRALLLFDGARLLLP